MSNSDLVPGITIEADGKSATAEMAKVGEAVKATGFAARITTRGMTDLGSGWAISLGLDGFKHHVSRRQVRCALRTLWPMVKWSCPELSLKLFLRENPDSSPGPARDAPFLTGAKFDR